MDGSGISVQVLSLSNPGVQMWPKKEALTWARRTNDDLAEMIKNHPDRFIGLVSVATQDPENAAAEIERCVAKPGVKGVNLLSHSQNEYLDNKKYWPIFEAAEEAGVPVYLHPGIPFDQNPRWFPGLWFSPGRTHPRFCCRCFTAYDAPDLRRSF